MDNTLGYELSNGGSQKDKFNKEKNMKYVKIAAPWLFRAYIVWSICADLFLIGLAVWYFFF